MPMFSPRVTITVTRQIEPRRRRAPLLVASSGTDWDRKPVIRRLRQGEGEILSLQHACSVKGSPISRRIAIVTLLAAMTSDVSRSPTEARSRRVRRRERGKNRTRRHETSVSIPGEPRKDGTDGTIAGNG
ncbi:MAG: hypothetical protein IT338_04980 [Thermomicrobiales bacterium]|nr:hypothetical protein [Thermomicrobiales bacterium]